ncbi:hypothetical protein [Phenylobacterium montanum]|uniref:Secreted protein n=1 Tax=Phenylobacterium montanum TaxID=2823693 RepID=A0A975IV67_9CAUL|nr:hypothetical protein [Caulobacter sp. S6]QUD88470.1 hypothetical protein KCG34_00810 [Caulobacter sp. S6]
MRIGSIGLGVLLLAVAAGSQAGAQIYGQKPAPPVLYPQQHPMATPAPNPNGAAQPGNGQTPYGARPNVLPYNPPATPLPADPNVATARNPVYGAALDPSGYGWCRYTDDAHKRTFYSAPFPGSPKHDTTPRDAAFADYIHRVYPGFKGNVDCYWQPFDSAYESRATEEHNESADQLRNYQMQNTQWKPTA